MPSLLLFIPTYNRCTKLKLCVERVLAEMEGCEDDVVVHISDNASTDGTMAYLQSLQNARVTISRNEENLGGARNILKVHEHAHRADFSMILGDDDYLFGGALKTLVTALKNNSDVDFFFLNSMAFEESQSVAILSALAASNFAAPSTGNLKSKNPENIRCTFRDLIDPSVDEVFCGSLMCYAFRSAAVRDVVSQHIHGIEFGGLYSSYPHTLNWIYSLQPHSSAAHLARPFTFNFWHQGSEWGKQTYHRVVTQGLGFLFFEMVRLGFITPDTYVPLFNHYIYISGTSLRHLLQDANTRTDAVLDARFLERMLAAILLHDGARA